MTVNLSTAQIVADSTGVIVYLPGDTLQTKQQAPRAPDLCPVKTFTLPGDSYAIEYDSTGEVYAIFKDSSDAPVSGPILLARGMSLEITATRIEIFGIRRAGVLRITAGQNGAKSLVSNSPSSYTEHQELFYPQGVNVTTGPAGWTTVSHPYAPNAPGLSRLAYNPSKTLDLSGVLQGSARRVINNAVTAANYYLLQYGFVDLDENNNIVRFYPYNDVAVSSGLANSTYGVDAQTYWHPAIMWWSTTAGVTANLPSPGVYYWCNSDYTFKRTPGQSIFDFT